MKTKILSFILVGGLAFICQGGARAAMPSQTIKMATASCEKEVPQNCIEKTCPAYCERYGSSKAKNDCKTGCTAGNRCKLKPLAGKDDPKNQALDADNRDKLFACIAEKRDPEGTKSGRRMEPWQTLMTPSMKKWMGVR